MHFPDQITLSKKSFESQVCTHDKTSKYCKLVKTPKRKTKDNLKLEDCKRENLTGYGITIQQI